MRHSRRTHERFSAIGTLLLAALFVGAAAVIQADPFTTHLDPLIAELEARSAALEGATDKLELKKKKTIDKLLRVFDKDSKGPDKDLKAAGKAAKKLAKVYPEEFLPQTISASAALPAGLGADNLADLILQALELFGGDIDALLAAAQQTVDAAPAGKCQDKAQSALDQVEELLADADAAPDLPGLSKGLAKALKKTLKAEALAEKALQCVPKLGAGISIATISVNGESANYFDDAFAPGEDELLATYFDSNNSLFIGMFGGQTGVGLSFAVSAAIGSHFVVADFTDPGQTIQNMPGTVTITKFGAVPGHVHGTFNFAVSGTEVTGSFAIYAFGGP